MRELYFIVWSETQNTIIDVEKATLQPTTDYFTSQTSIAIGDLEEAILQLTGDGLHHSVISNTKWDHPHRNKLVPHTG